MALARKVAANTVIQVLTKIASTGLSLISMALITRYLGQYGFGQFTTAITFVTFFSIAADLGLTLVATQLISRPGADASRMMSNLFSFRLVTAVAIIALAPLSVWLFPYDAVVKQGVGIASLAFLFVILCQIFVSLFQRELVTNRIAIAEVGSRFVMVAVTAVAVYKNWGVSGVLWAMTVANILSFGIHYIFARRFVALRWLYEPEIWKDILSRSWPLIVTIVMNLVYLKADTLLLSLMKSQSEVGLYGAAYRVIDVLVTIPFMIGGTVLPILTARWLSAARDDYQRVWQRVFDASAILAWPLMIGGFVFATPIMVLISGSQFAISGSILKILIFAVGAVFFSSFFSYTMLSFDRQRKLIPAYMITATVSLGLYLVLIPRFSYFGAASVTIVSETLVGFLSWIAIRRVSRLRIAWKCFLKALASAVVMGGVLLALHLPMDNFWELLGGVVLGTVIYGLVLYGLKGLSKAELKEILGKPTAV